jgi:hypothetical protein
MRLRRLLSYKSQIEVVIFVNDFASPIGNQPIRLPGLKPGVCSGLILSGAYYPNLKIGVLRRERIKFMMSF